MPQQLVVDLTSVKGKPVPCDVMYTVDQRNFPFWSEWRSAGPGQWAIAYPKTEPFGIAVLWEVPGFGKIIVTADNEGKGYRMGEQQALDFRLEAAKSKVKKVRERAQALRTEGYQFGPELQGRIEGAANALASALGSQGEAAARQADEALREAFWAGEEMELAKARSDIGRMSAEERKSLLFGSPFFNPNPSEHFKQRFAEVFNFATLPFYRARFEPEEGKPDWELRNRCLDWLELQGIKAKGHPLSWINDSGLAPWMRRLSYATLKEVIYRQIYETVSYYKDRIKIWDVINEAHDWWGANSLQLNRDQLVEMTRVAAQATRDADPEAIRIVNCMMPWGCYREKLESRDLMHPIEYFELLAQGGVEYEVLGLQMYHSGQDHWVRDMSEQSALIDQYIALGKPIHITELQTPSSVEMGTPPRELAFEIGEAAGWWHRPWYLETQADWVEQFYSIAISKPAVGAITWWGLSDRRSFWPHGGFLDAQDMPKPSFHRLKSLIASIRQA